MTDNQLKRAMSKLAKLSQETWSLSDKIEQELINRGLDVSINGLRDGSGVSLEELEAGLDISDELMHRIYCIMDGCNYEQK